ncbi:aminopeptidase NAALADL1-like [Amblyomma americanum]
MKTLSNSVFSARRFRRLSRFNMSHPEARDFSEVRQVSSAGLCGVGSNLLSSSASRLLVYTAVAVVLATATTSLLVVGIQRTESTVKTAATKLPSAKPRAVMEQRKVNAPTTSPRSQDSVHMMLGATDVRRIKEHFGNLTAETHLSGEPGGKHAAEYVARVLRSCGLHKVVEVPHRITHSYPEPGKPNHVQLLESNGHVVHEATFMEKKKSSKSKSVVSGYLAFSPNGIVKANMIFVNYGRRKDMEQLEENGVSAKGRICLARLGGAHAVDKARNCHEYGGVGLLVFADPEDVAPQGPSKVYPNTGFVDGSALQRGSLYHYGDPETPAYPSVDKALREVDASNLSPIPALVIGYDDASVLLKSLGGEALGWKGGLSVPYKTGPLFPEGRLVKMSVFNKRVTRVVNSVLGIVKGSSEQDRFIITGAHHDSWGVGAAEPTSATAALLELGHALGTMLKKGWTPRRTIVLASWAAGEMAFAGASEWVEENIVLLDAGAVGYVNVDSCASGPRFAVHASPTLREVVYSAAAKVPSGNGTLLQAWEKAEKKQRPRIPYTHGVGDHAAFNFYAGIPSVDFTFRPERARPSGWFPSYHTAYDDGEVFARKLDPQYALTLRCCQMNGAMTLRLAEDAVLPYRVAELAKELQAAVGGLDQSLRRELAKHNISLDWLKSETVKFQQQAKSFESWLKANKKIDKPTRRWVNERLMMVERAFIKREGLLGRANVRNMAFGTDPEDAFAGKALAFMHEHAYHARKIKDARKAASAWEEANMDLSRLVLAVRMGAQLLDMKRTI